MGTGVRPRYDAGMLLSLCLLPVAVSLASAQPTNSSAAQPTNPPATRPATASTSQPATTQPAEPENIEAAMEGLRSCMAELQRLAPRPTVLLEPAQRDRLRGELLPLTDRLIGLTKSMTRLAREDTQLPADRVAEQMTQLRLNALAIRVALGDDDAQATLEADDTPGGQAMLFMGQFLGGTADRRTALLGEVETWVKQDPGGEMRIRLIDGLHEVCRELDPALLERVEQIAALLTGPDAELLRGEIEGERELDGELERDANQ